MAKTNDKIYGVIFYKNGGWNHAKAKKFMTFRGFVKDQLEEYPDMWYYKFSDKPKGAKSEGFHGAKPGVIFVMTPEEKWSKHTNKINSFFGCRNITMSQILYSSAVADDVLDATDGEVLFEVIVWQWI